MLNSRTIIINLATLLNFDPDFVSCSVSGMEDDQFHYCILGCVAGLGKSLISIHLIKFQSKCVLIKCYPKTILSS